MTASFKALGLDQLRPAERIQLAGELLDSVSSSLNAPLLSDTHLADLQRRLDEYRSDPLADSTWDVVKARLLRGGDG